MKIGGKPMNECLFCGIAAGEIPCETVYEDARVLAFRHPISGEPMRFETEIPPQFVALLR